MAQVAVEHRIRRPRQAAFDQIHQQESEVVQHIGGGKFRIELEGVEQHRLAVDLHDIAEMQVAVTVPYHPGAFARFKQRMRLVEREPRRLDQRAEHGRRKQFRRLDQVLFVLLGDLAQDAGEIGVLDHRSGVMRLGDRAAEAVCERRINLAGVRQMIERLALVEPDHLDRPFHRHSAAADAKAIAVARDRNHTAIKLWRERTVGLDLRFASRLSLVQCGEIEERKFHRTFDLEGAGPRQKYSRRMGVEARNLGPAMRRRTT